MTPNPDTITLDPAAIEMLDILAVNFVWHMRTHPDQQQLAWDHFYAIIQGRQQPSQSAVAEAMNDKPETGIYQ